MGNRHPQHIHQDHELSDRSNRQTQARASEPLMSGSEESRNGGIIQTVTITSDVHILGNSFNVIHEADSPTWTFEFKFNSNSECLISIYYFAYEVMSSNFITQYYQVDTNRYPPPESFKFPAGLNQLFPRNKINLDLAKYSSNELCFSDGRCYPVVIEIKPIDSPHRIVQIETSYLTFFPIRDDFALKLLEQKLTYGDRAYLINEIFCIPREERDSEDTQECVVCMTSLKDTVLLPCFHMCVCSFCANILRSQPNPRCPICRTGVDKLLEVMLNPSENT